MVIGRPRGAERGRAEQSEAEGTRPFRYEWLAEGGHRVDLKAAAGHRGLAALPLRGLAFPRGGSVPTARTARRLALDRDCQLTSPRTIPLLVHSLPSVDRDRTGK